MLWFLFYFTKCKRKKKVIDISTYVVVCSQVVPLYIKTASVFYGRIVKKGDNDFDSLASEMASYYGDKKLGAKEMLEGGLYAVQEDDVFHRFDIIIPLSLSANDGNFRLHT